MSTNEPIICTNCRGIGVAPGNILDDTQAGKPCPQCDGAGSLNGIAPSREQLLAAAWEDGHMAGFWNGRESLGDTEGKPIGQDHATITNPHAGGTGFTPTMLVVGQLTVEHTGKTVTVTGGGATVTGVLIGVSHKREMIYDPVMFAEPGTPEYVPGQAKTVVTLIPDLELVLNPNSEVEVIP